ncbi:hypothetical protein RGQ15_20070 [Paracoccus sp. MBLB3053]|uniref:Recombinase family protein n=1 Tax=Paracoccus aurantius TaxID=3073814 RepID=A0ABU2HXR9_9RHOB|nr:hypothetical protein [Paracoccus sp. MBLB3053]MDS9469859.1 hypothetical protein [Paracoccus sp. MBLB3053]
MALISRLEPCLVDNVDRLLEAARDVPAAAVPALDVLAGQLRDTQARIEKITVRIGKIQGEDQLARISARRGRRKVASDRATDWLDRMIVRKPLKVVAPASDRQGFEMVGRSVR